MDRKTSTAISAGRQLTAAQLNTCLAIHRRRVRRLSWEGQTPEQQRLIRQIVDLASITLRREMV